MDLYVFLDLSRHHFHLIFLWLFCYFCWSNWFFFPLLFFKWSMTSFWFFVIKVVNCVWVESSYQARLETNKMAIWLLLLPCKAEVNSALSDFYQILGVKNVAQRKKSIFAGIWFCVLFGRLAVEWEDLRIVPKVLATKKSNRVIKIKFMVKGLCLLSGCKDFYPPGSNNGNLRQSLRSAYLDDI